jgi:preprotein translocase subunit Sss1
MRSPSQDEFSSAFRMVSVSSAAHQAAIGLRFRGGVGFSSRAWVA